MPRCQVSQTSDISTRWRLQFSSLLTMNYFEGECLSSARLVLTLSYVLTISCWKHSHLAFLISGHPDSHLSQHLQSHQRNCCIGQRQHSVAIVLAYILLYSSRINPQQLCPWWGYQDHSLSSRAWRQSLDSPVWRMSTEWQEHWAASRLPWQKRNNGFKKFNVD